MIMRSGYISFRERIYLKSWSKSLLHIFLASSSGFWQKIRIGSKSHSVLVVDSFSDSNFFHSNNFLFMTKVSSGRD